MRNSKYILLLSLHFVPVKVLILLSMYKGNDKESKVCKYLSNRLVFARSLVGGRRIIDLQVLIGKYLQRK